MQGRKCHTCEEEENNNNKNKQKYINGTENILWKDFTTGGVRIYDQKFSLSLDIGAAWNSLRSGISNIWNCQEVTET